MRLIGYILAGLMFTSMPAAADSQLVSMDTADSLRGYEGVGRLNLGPTGFCTASLVTPDVILTAAHCLFYKATGDLIPLDQIEFQAGLRNGRAEAYRSIRRVVLHPAYRFEGADQLERVGKDMALLQLSAPIRQSGITPYRTQLRVASGSNVEVVSYAKDREDAPALEPDCVILTRDEDVMVLSCEVDFGASGAPIFMRFGDENRIVSVVSAKAEWQNRPVALAAVLEGELDALIAAFRGEPAGPIAATNIEITTAIRNVPGAKFVRPGS
jgi:protease YdgD